MRYFLVKCSFCLIFVTSIGRFVKAQRGGCGDVDLQASLDSSQTISSRNFPRSYPSNENCWWTITAVERAKIILTFHYFQTQTCCDRVIIYDSSAPIQDASLEIERRAGSIRRGFTVVSRNNYIAVNFISDSSLQFQGFQFSFQATYDEPSTETITVPTTIYTRTTRATRSSSGCGFEDVASIEPRQLSFPEVPGLYRSNSDCEWRISAEQGNIVQFTIGRIGTERCCDYIEIWDDGRRLERLRDDLGNAIKRYISSTFRGLRITFRSDSSVNRRGFQGAYRSVVDERPYPILDLLPFCGQNYQATWIRQDLDSPGWPNSYPISIDCNWVITASPGMVIEFTVLEANIEVCCDYLDVVEEGGATIRINGIVPSVRPLVLISNYTSLNLTFHSDDTITKAGFHGAFRQISPPTTTSATQMTTTEAPETPEVVEPQSINDLAAVDRNCGSDNHATNESVIISSPLHPLRYSANANCIWRILPQSGELIQFTIGEIDTELCCDHIEIFNGNERMARLSGSIDGENTYRASINALVTVTFQSDQTVNREGFRGIFRSVPQSESNTELQLPNLVLCGFDSEAVETQRELQTPGYPTQDYPNYAECSWTLHAATEGMVVLFTLLQGRTEPCCDFFEIFDGPRSLGRVNGTITTPRRFYSTGSSLMVQFQSDGNIRFPGYLATFQEVNPPTLPPTTQPTPTTQTALCEHELIARVGLTSFISSPNYPSSYDARVNCVWTIHAANPNDRVRLNLVEIATEPCCDFVEIAFLPGEPISQYAGTQSNITFVSRGSQILITFRSDRSDQRKGFLASYTSLRYEGSLTTASSLPLSTPKQECGFTADAIESPLSLNSPGRPDTMYPSNINCEWILRAPVGGKIQINFTFVETEECCDHIEVWENRSFVEGLSGVVDFRSITTMGNILFINFTSDKSIRRAGFDATYLLIPPPTTTTTTTPIPTTTTIAHYSRCGFTRIFLEDSPVYISSPSYPFTYPHNSNCTWRIQAPPGRRIDVEFDQVDIEECCDCIELKDGEDDRIILRSNKESVLLSTNNHRSTTNILSVSFVTDHSVAGNGFLARVRLAPENSTLETGICGFTKTGSADSFDFYSPGYPNEYPAHIECNWLLLASTPNRPVELKIADFKVERCCDKLEIHDGRNANAPLVETLHSIRGSRIYTSTTDALYLTFTTDFTVNFRGFRGSFREGEPLREYPEQCYEVKHAHYDNIDIIKDKDVVECSENSTCMLINATTLVASEFPVGDSHTGKLIYGSCVPTTLCDAATCHTLAPIVASMDAEETITISDCSITCCPDDLCNDGIAPDPISIPEYLPPRDIPSTLAPTPPRPTDSNGCWRYTLDLMFLVDGSGTMEQRDFDKTLSFVKDVASGFDLEQVHIGVMQYSYWYRNRPMTVDSQPWLETFISVGQHENIDDLEDALSGVLIHGWTTSTAHAIEKAFLIDMPASSRYGEACNRKGIVVVTDSRAQDAIFLSTYASIARSIGIEMYSVGIRDYSMIQLQMISSSEIGNYDRILTVNTFDELHFVVEPLQTALEENIRFQL